MKVLNRIAFAAVAALSLASCREYGPVATELEFARDVSFESKRGWIDVPAGKQDVVATLSGDKITLRVAGEEVVFKGAKLDKKRGVFSVSYKKSKQETRSGERLGAEFRRTLACDPDCERSESFDDDRTCTYYERRLSRRCWHDRAGRTRCENFWEEYPVRGWQRVRVTEIERDYLVTGEITGERDGPVATGRGVYTETHVEERALTACR